jgi:hypothetical protein
MSKERAKHQFRGALKSALSQTIRIQGFMYGRAAIRRTKTVAYVLDSSRHFDSRNAVLADTIALRTQRRDFFERMESVK